MSINKRVLIFTYNINRNQPGNNYLKANRLQLSKGRIKFPRGSYRPSSDSKQYIIQTTPKMPWSRGDSCFASDIHCGVEYHFVHMGSQSFDTPTLASSNWYCTLNTVTLSTCYFYIAVNYPLCLRPVTVLWHGDKIQGTVQYIFI